MQEGALKANCKGFSLFSPRKKLRNGLALVCLGVLAIAAGSWGVVSLIPFEIHNPLQEDGWPRLVFVVLGALAVRCGLAQLRSRRNVGVVLDEDGVTIVWPGLFYGTRKEKIAFRQLKSFHYSPSYGDVVLRLKTGSFRLIDHCQYDTKEQLELLMNTLEQKGARRDLVDKYGD
jgi:hypothetical protein